MPYAQWLTKQAELSAAADTGQTMAFRGLVVPQWPVLLSLVFGRLLSRCMAVLYRIGPLDNDVLG